MNWDLTADKLNTLSDQAIDIAKGIEQETTIYLIGEEEAYRKDRLYSSYGLEYSQVSNLAEKLREHRVRCKMTQEFVAESLGVSRQAVSKWESGASDPSTSNLLALAKLYGVSAEELLRNVSSSQDKKENPFIP